MEVVNSTNCVLQRSPRAKAFMAHNDKMKKYTGLHGEDVWRNYKPPVDSDQPLRDVQLKVPALAGTAPPPTNQQSQPGEPEDQAIAEVSPTAPPTVHLQPHGDAGPIQPLEPANATETSGDQAAQPSEDESPSPPPQLVNNPSTGTPNEGGNRATTKSSRRRMDSPVAASSGCARPKRSRHWPARYRD